MSGWIPLVVSWATSLALLAWALSLHRELEATERERDDMWDELNGQEEWQA